MGLLRPWGSLQLSDLQGNGVLLRPRAPCGYRICRVVATDGYCIQPLGPAAVDQGRSGGSAVGARRPGAQRGGGCHPRGVAILHCHALPHPCEVSPNPNMQVSCLFLSQLCIHRFFVGQADFGGPSFCHRRRNQQMIG